MLHTKELGFQMGSKALLKNCSLKFSQGKLYGLIGPNGSGKTTFLKLLAALLKPSHGEIFWKDSSIFKAEKKVLCRIIRYAAPSLLPSFPFTTHQTVAMGRYPHEKHPLPDDPLILKCLEDFDLLPFAKRTLVELSSGERQRVALASAFATDTEVLLLDEPTSYLDIKYQIHTWDLLKKLSLKKIVIVAHHDLTQVAKYCDCVCVLKHGECVGFGAPKEVLTNQLWQFVFEVDPQ